MNAFVPNPMQNPPPPMAHSGQPARLPGSDRDAGLHDQLYRYAEDLQQMVERNGQLQTHYEMLKESCARLTESRYMLDELIGSSRDMHIVTDAEGMIRQTNPATAALGVPANLTGSNLRDWVLPSHQGNFDALRQRALGKTLGGDEWELRLRREGFNEVPIIVSAQAIAVQRDEASQSLHWILRDITHLREVQFETQISAMVFRSAAEGVMITDVEGEILAINPAFSRITGYTTEEVVGRNPSMLSSGMHDEAFYDELWRSLREKGSWQGEIYNRRKGGEIYPEWLTISAARDGDGHILSYIAVFSDLSRLLQTERRMAYLAHHDTLTGLPNRLLFQDRLAQALSQARRNGSGFTLIFIDLDRFKQINDTLGHEVGDSVLREAAHRLVGAVREVDTVARLGGDEFVILAPELADVSDIDRVAAKVIAALGQPIQIDHHELFIGASLGCAQFPAHGQDEVSLLKHADIAMYRAKAAGGNCHFIFSASQAGDHGQLAMETELRHALERNELRLEYQPQIAAGDGALLGVEALLRWDHPNLGRVPPDKFIPIAEQTGLIVPIGAWVLEAACRQLAAWDGQGLPNLTLAVNISPRQLRDPAIIDKVRGAIAASGIEPARLELEVTETEVMYHLDADRAKFSALREMGVRIAIDDFGTGYSSLARLRDLPIDRLKIDRSFVSELGQEGDVQARAICAAILAMGMALGLDLVAEGVESTQQLDVMSAHGCRVIQGFLTGRPMPPQQFSAWASDHFRQWGLERDRRQAARYASASQPAAACH